MTDFVPPPTRIPRTPYVRPNTTREDVLRLDGNEGNRPPPDVLQRLAEGDIGLLRDYPRLDAIQQRIADRFAVNPDRVVVTTGADDAIDRMLRAFVTAERDQLVLPVPAFEMLYRFAQTAGAELITVPWTDAYPVAEVTAALSPRTALAVVVTPNNPSGRVATTDEVGRVAAAAAEVGALVLLDLAYIEYAEDDPTATGLTYPNVVVARTFSKAWGLAGCRVGYAIASTEVAAVIRNAGNPYPVSGPALAVVLDQLERGRDAFDDHVTRVRRHRDRLTQRLTGWGAGVPPSQGNFVLADMGARVDLVYAGLAAFGVLVRFFPHRPEIATALRITVPDTEPDLERLIDGLGLCLDPEGLLFDMDGVLADVEDSYRRCDLETARAFGVDLARDDLDAAILAGDANNDWVLTQRLLATRGVEVSLDEVTTTYQRLYLGTDDQPGYREAERLMIPRERLTQWAARYPLGVVTGRPRAEAEWFLDRFGIRDLFRSVICLEDGPNKPDPTPVRLAREALGVERAWLIGDTPDDVRAAIAADVLPIGVAATPEATAALRAAGAARVLDSTIDLETCFP